MHTSEMPFATIEEIVRKPVIPLDPLAASSRLSPIERMICALLEKDRIKRIGLAALLQDDFFSDLRAAYLPVSVPVSSSYTTPTTPESSVGRPASLFSTSSNTSKDILADEAVPVQFVETSELVKDILEQDLERRDKATVTIDLADRISDLAISKTSLPPPAPSNTQ